MGRRKGGRSVMDAVTGTRNGGQVSKRDPGPWLLPVLPAGVACLLALGGLPPGGSWWPAAGALAVAAALAVRALTLTRADRYAARRDLLSALRALGVIPADSAVLLSRDARLVHIVTVKSVRLLPWPIPGRLRKVTITEVGEGYLASVAASGSGHLTGREFTLIPWESGVRMAIRDATFRPGGGEAGQLAFSRQWYPGELTTAGQVRGDWRAWRDGTLHAPPAEVRALAGMLATAEVIDRAGGD